MATAYLVIYLLTRFDGNQSTDLQRGFVLAWLILGQGYGWALYSLRGRNGMISEILRLGLTLFVGVGAMGGFVIVAKMMIDDEVCAII